MNTQSFSGLGATMFLLIAVVHLIRIFYGWPILVGTMEIPMWTSWLAVIITGILAYSGFRIHLKCHLGQYK